MKKFDFCRVLWQLPLITTPINLRPCMRKHVRRCTSRDDNSAHLYVQLIRRHSFTPYIRIRYPYLYPYTLNLPALPTQAYALSLYTYLYTYTFILTRLPREETGHTNCTLYTYTLYLYITTH